MNHATLRVFFFLLLSAVKRGGGHPLLPHVCRVGVAATDCTAVGSCECYRACERMYALSGHQAYCHNTSGTPSSWHELLRCVDSDLGCAPRVVPATRRLC